MRRQVAMSAESIGIVGDRGLRGAIFVVIDGRDPVLLQEPAAQVHHLATFGTERPPTGGRVDGPLAGRADKARSRTGRRTAHFDFFEPDPFELDAPESDDLPPDSPDRPESFEVAAGFASEDFESEDFDSEDFESDDFDSDDFVSPPDFSSFDFEELSSGDEAFL